MLSAAAATCVYDIFSSRRARSVLRRCSDTPAPRPRIVVVVVIGGGCAFCVFYSAARPALMFNIILILHPPTPLVVTGADVVLYIIILLYLYTLSAGRPRPTSAAAPTMTTTADTKPPPRIAFHIIF